MSKIISVSEVRMNELNYYPSDDEMVTSLSEHIARDGQLENATVYCEQKNDGRIYTLIGGETRYRAICKLVEEGRSNGDFKVEVIEKPDNMQEELRLITEDNVQRKKTMEVRYHEILKLENIYNRFEEKPAGKKRDWIGQMLGISGRMVDNIKNKYSQRETNTSASSTQRTYTQNDLKNSLNRATLNIKKAIQVNQNLSVLTDDDIEKLNLYVDELNDMIRGL